MEVVVVVVVPSVGAMKTGNRVKGSLLLTYLLPSEFFFFGPPLRVLIPSSDLSLKRMIKEKLAVFFSL
jgi:hypothetical protein